MKWIIEVDLKKVHLLGILFPESNWDEWPHLFMPGPIGATAKFGKLRKSLREIIWSSQQGEVILWGPPSYEGEITHNGIG